MLQEYGYCLSLDTIKSVAKTLCDYGSDKKCAAKASASALKDYLDQLESALSDVTSVDELETFDRDLNAAMRAYGVTDVMVDFISTDAVRSCSSARAIKKRPPCGARRRLREICPITKSDHYLGP
jgi:hypothetical protein